MSNHLFRQQVLDNKTNKNLGSISINTPIKYRIVAIAYSIFLIAFIIFCSCVELPEKYRVKGYLNSTQGLVAVYAKREGVVNDIIVHPGQTVHQGDPLFAIDTRQDGLDNNSNFEAILTQRQSRLQQEIALKSQHLKQLKPLLEKQFITNTEFNSEKDALNNLYENLHGAETELIRYKQDQSYLIYAPIEGIISNLNYHLGQRTHPSKPLLKIVPKNTKLQAELFIPARQAGFLNKDGKVIIHYDAYPYQHFGSFNAQITEVSRTIQVDEEDEKPFTIGEPYYKVNAILGTSKIKLYGQDKTLLPGMTLSAMIIGSKRKVWQWALDPIYSFERGL